MKLLGLILGLSLLSQSALAQPEGLPAMNSEQAPKPNPAAPMYRQTGEQYRAYEFPGTGESIPYRLFVPETWTADQHLPILITLRAGNSINNNHRGNNDLVLQAREHGYILISPLGYRGYSQPYYGSPYPVIRPNGPSVPADGWSAQDDARAQADVLYVLGLVGAEYSADMSHVAVHGQNPSGSAALNFVAQYPQVFAAAIVSSGPIVTDNYPFANLKDKVSVMVLHGEKDTNNPIAASQALAQALETHGIHTQYLTIPEGEHLTAYLLVADQIYDFLDGL